jgi:hypothetical protein
MKPLVGLAIACFVASACDGFERGAQGSGLDCSTISATNSDDCVRLNEIQVLGTHNSYHIAPPSSLLATLGSRGRDIEYTHRPVTEQLSQLGIRQFELDVYPTRTAAASPRPRLFAC